MQLFKVVLTFEVEEEAEICKLFRSLTLPLWECKSQGSVLKLLALHQATEIDLLYPTAMNKDPFVLKKIESYAVIFFSCVYCFVRPFFSAGLYSVPLSRTVLPPIRGTHGTADQEKKQYPQEEEAGKPIFFFFKLFICTFHVSSLLSYIYSQDFCQNCPLPDHAQLLSPFPFIAPWFVKYFKSNQTSPQQLNCVIYYMLLRENFLD